MQPIHWFMVITMAMGLILVSVMWLIDWLIMEPRPDLERE